jgi:hypothetical protein
MTTRVNGLQRPSLARACWLIVLALPLASAAAQLIPVKTVPVSEGDQFGFLPAAKAGMAITIAVPDTVFDPFRNPAAAARLAHGFYFGAPTFYALSKNAGTGSTLPIGAFLKRGATFAGAMFAVQEIGPSSQSDLFGGNTNPVVLDASLVGGPIGSVRRRETNRYAYAIMGHTFAAANLSNLSIGASAFGSRFNGIDGSDLLYAGSQSVIQKGNALDLRLGLLKRWAGDRSLEVVALRERSTMAHDVAFQDAFWDPTTRQTKFSSRSEHNADQVQTIGAHLAYAQAIGDSTWRAGGIVTANRTTHPLMPVLGPMDLTREPGSSSAYNVGAGLSRVLDKMTVGADAIYEPIWGRTSQTGTANDDRYRFSNRIVRGGASRDFPLTSPGSSIRFMAGIQLKAVRYRLDQVDSTQTSQATTEHWNEWTHSADIGIITRSMEVHCLWRVRSGTSRPGTEFNNVNGSQTSVLTPVRTFTEQFSITVPIR